MIAVVVPVSSVHSLLNLLHEVEGELAVEVSDSLSKLEGGLLDLLPNDQTKPDKTKELVDYQIIQAHDLEYIKAGIRDGIQTITAGASMGDLNLLNIGKSHVSACIERWELVAKETARAKAG